MNSSAAVAARFDVQKVRADFPILSERVHGKPLVYLDSANTSQKPESVLRAMDDYYRHANANIHRATHLLSERATALYEGARSKASRFINAPDPRSVVLTKGTTDGINLVAQSYGRSTLRAGDEILISWLEHHSNIVPWQLLCEQTGAVLRVAPIDELGQIDLTTYAQLLSPRTKIVALSHVSNALGTINAVRPMIELAHARGAVCCSTAPRPFPTWWWTCNRSTAISTCFRATRCTARQVWACCTDARRCSRRCRRTKAVAT
jgi:cysteine desulfurase/selenocysteine lyase